MRRLRLLDGILLACFLPLWLVCFGLHLVALARGELAWVPASVSAGSGADPHPVVSGFWPDAEAEVGELRLGDRVLRVGDRDLAGAGPLRFFTLVHAAAAPKASVPAEIRRGEQRRPVDFRLRPVSLPWRLPIMSLGFALPAFLALLQRPGSRSVRAFFGAMLAYSLHWTFFMGGPPARTALWIAVFGVSAFLFYPLTLRAILSFPEEARPSPPGRRGGLGRLWIWLFAAYGLAASSWVFGVPFEPSVGVRASSALNAAAPLAILALLTHRYRKVDAIGRRQLKWILYGFTVGTVPVLVGSLIPTVAPRLWWIHPILMSAVVLLPVCVLIALVRHNLFDIDRLISATASYNVLLVVLVGAGFLLVPRVADASTELLGIDPALGRAAISLALAAVAVPANSRLRPAIERWLFAERHALETGVENLLEELAACDEPGQLTRRVGERLDALLRPERCAIYARSGGLFSPVFARGRALPPALPADGSLLSMLAERGRPTPTERLFRTRNRSGTWSPFDQAALDALDVALVVPVRRGGELAALLCLGGKRSGDVYTATDRALLAAVADRWSSRLERFEDAAVLRDARAMQEALRRYVPSAVAEELASGGELAPGEREVSVLFVDIRGYTTFSQGRRAQEIFSAVSRYTQVVSDVVRQHGGSVVEFHGDGLLAIFGAPRALPEKERAAVEAGRAIVAAVATLELEPGLLPAGTLSVGVGIATGETFVGDIQAVDRKIWTSIGNTVNLAARLEALTRTLDAAMVVDESTWRASGEAGRGFEKHDGMRIRGRSEEFELYALPLAKNA